MKLFLFHLIVGFVFFTGCVTTDNPVTIQEHKSSEAAPFPEMRVGDTWVEDTYRGILHTEVINVNNDGSYVMQSKNEKSGDIFHLYYDDKGQLTKKINTITKELSVIPEPPQKELSFPLYVGKKWEDRYSVIGNDYQNKYSVEAMETVSTRAGDFIAYKIARTYFLWWTMRSSTYWYSPEIKTIVKSNPSWSKGTELLSYQLAEKAPENAKVSSTDHENEGSETDVQTIAIQDDDQAREKQTKEQAAFVRPSEMTEDIKESLSDSFPVTQDLSLPKVKSARWAVVIGVSEYRDNRIPSLRYAASDARLFHQWLVSPAGGRYAPSRTLLLTDEKATFSNIKKGLYEWLSQALEEDIVVIYFAGHGSPSSPDSKNMFLLPYDADYESIATTGFPMWDIETALERFIKAKRVIVIADACHAGGVGEAFDIARRSGHGSAMVNPISEGFSDLAQVGEGVCIISASAIDQYSQESRRWGGGQGVFTYFLNKGLSGDADYNKDGKVSLGEIIPYLSENVRRDTQNAQSPTVAGRFDPALHLGR